MSATGTGGKTGEPIRFYFNIMFTVDRFNYTVDDFGVDLIPQKKVAQREGEGVTEL